MPDDIDLDIDDYDASGGYKTGSGGGKSKLLGQSAASDDISQLKGGDASKLLGQSANNPWSNFQNNLSQTWGNFSQGNILSGLADVYTMKHDPAGAWGTNSLLGVSSNSKPLPQFDPSKHLGPADENGYQPFTQDFLNQHSQPIPLPSMQNNDQSQGSIPGTGGSGGGVGKSVAANLIESYM